MLKKILIPILILCLLLTGCAKTPEASAPEAKPVEQPAASEAPAVEESAEEASRSIAPLPDTTMDNLSDCILSVSLDKDSVYTDESGTVQMSVKIYSYDKYDMVDISMLREGDTIISHSGEVEVSTLERKDGCILINGGLDANGIELATDDYGVFFESGYNDAKSWYEVGEATFPLAEGFVCYDYADMDKGEVLLNADSFINGEIEVFYFSPHNTGIRLEKGQVVEMNRIYVP